MLTENKEDYLTEILKLQEDRKKISGKDLSEILNISQASVSEMLKKLKEEGLVKRDNTLTDQGVEIARFVASVHRLWERFLVDKLGLSWTQVHQQAHLFEHVTGEETLEALNKFLDYPTRCPHGGSIYMNLKEDIESKKLLELQVGDVAKIVRVKDDKDFLEFIEEKGVNLGDQVKIVDINSFDKLRIAEINGSIKALSPKACNMIYVD